MKPPKYTCYHNGTTLKRWVLIAATNTEPERRVYEDEQPAEYRRLRRKARRNANQRAHDQVMRDTGLVKTPYGWE